MTLYKKNGEGGDETIWFNFFKSNGVGGVFVSLFKSIREKI